MNPSLIHEPGQAVVDDPNQPSFSIGLDSNFYWGAQKAKADDEDKDKDGKQSKSTEKKEHQEILKQRESAKKDAKQVADGQNSPQQESEQALLPDKQIEAKADPKEVKTDVKVKELLALKDLNFSVKKGQFVCIIGDVGAGKSSLLATLIGDLQYLEANKKAHMQE